MSEEESTKDPKAPAAATGTEEAPARETPAKEVPGKEATEKPASPEAAAKEAPPEKPKETAADLLKSDLEDVKIRRAKGSKNISAGVCHVLATFNNTKVTFSDPRGNVISWASAGKCNFRGSRKSTAYASQVVTQTAGRVAMSHGMKEVVVKVKGPGLGRDSAIRALQALGFIVTDIVDVTPVPHNGCRPPKRRRV